MVSNASSAAHEFYGSDILDKKTTMIVAAAVVVIVVIAAAAAAITRGGGDGDPGESIASQLQIMGNANDDYTIDDKDMEIVDDIIAGTKSFTDYPLADANNDGKVDVSDKQLLQDIIDRKSGTVLRVMCLDTSGNNTVVDVEYPLRNVVTYATNMQLPVLYANGGQYIVGYFTSSYEVAEGSINPAAKDLEGSSREISDASWTLFTQLDAGLDTGVGAFLTDYSAVAQITASRQADLDAAGIPLIIYPSANAADEITTVLTLGFLFGGDCESLAVEYAQASWDVVNAIDSVVGDLSDSEKTTYISCTMWIYICEGDSTYNTTATDAGGNWYGNVNSGFGSTYSGDGSTKMQSVEALSNYQDVDVVINVRSMDWGLTADEMRDLIIDDCWEKDRDGYAVKDYFAGLEENMYFVNNILPGAVKLAYMAHILYGDDFSMEWADGTLQQFIDMGTAPLEGQTVDSIPACIDHSDYLDAKA